MPDSTYGSTDGHQVNAEAYGARPKDSTTEKYLMSDITITFFCEGPYDSRKSYGKRQRNDRMERNSTYLDLEVLPLISSCFSPASMGKLSNLFRHRHTAPRGKLESLVCNAYPCSAAIFVGHIAEEA